MSEDKKLLGGIDLTLNCGESFIPINPETNEPYYQSIFEENDAVWVGQKVVPTNFDMEKSCFEVRGYE